MSSSGIVILLELVSHRSKHILHSLHQASSIKNINIRIIKLSCISAPRSWPHTVVLTILTFQHIQCLHLMYAEVAWELVSSGTQVQPQIILNPDYLPNYLSVSYDCFDRTTLAVDYWLSNQYVSENRCSNLMIKAFEKYMERN